MRPHYFLKGGPKMLKKILRSLIFLGLLGLLLVPVSLVLQPKNNTEEAGMYQASAAGILSQPQHSIDVLFLGDSEAYSSFVPLDLWTQAGIPSFVCSSLDQKTYETVELLQMALSCQKPRVVVLETNVLYRVYPSTDVLAPTLEAKIPALRYHDRWKSLKPTDFFSLPSYTAASPDRGYHLLLRSKAAQLEGYMKPMDEWEPLSKSNLKNLKKILRLCQENDIPLVLFSAPSPANWTMRRHNTVSDTAESLGVPYIDGNLLDLGIDWEADTYDQGDHLNYYGAKKVTEYLGQYLQDAYSLPDRRSIAAYAPWTQDAAAFQARIEAAQ